MDDLAINAPASGGGGGSGTSSYLASLASQKSFEANAILSFDPADPFITPHGSDVIIDDFYPIALSAPAIYGWKAADTDFSVDNYSCDIEVFDDLASFDRSFTITLTADYTNIAGLLTELNLQSDGVIWTDYGGGILKATIAETGADTHFDFHSNPDGAADINVEVGELISGTDAHDEGRFVWANAGIYLVEFDVIVELSHVSASQTITAQPSGSADFLRSFSGAAIQQHRFLTPDAIAGNAGVASPVQGHASYIVVAQPADILDVVYQPSSPYDRVFSRIGVSISKIGSIPV